ncbi:NO-inducible flavohemoprotein [Marininema halotolerans]|uniref:Flavohemoprotein n=1 Tax=Marininema halotolerans TaxID=1155944 RepID=A0A1I6RIH7_9BACL|nr:NO-inducible flavohemoprotein [Marininema halotolerans]SFS64573.1 nitric oxide dioxygenase [Marininema halotolerans]
MLDERTIQIIKSTAPIIKEHGEEITRCFYQRLFHRHPELLNYFNQANQRQGRQQQALANAVWAVAENIDQLEKVLPMVEGIAHKHRALGVKAEQYPIVGENLLIAIQKVLGLSPTDEIMKAWEQAYGVIAEVFIGKEAEMTAKAANQHGGWSGFREFIVQKKVQESSVIASFYLTPADHGALPTFQPGQYITLQMSIPGSPYTHNRHYSLSNGPDEAFWRISVKHEMGGEADPDGRVSTYLHEKVGEGDHLWLSAPAGNFVLEKSSSRPVVFLSAGVGLTPLLSMFSSLVLSHSSREIVWIHATQNGDVHALAKEVEKWGKGKENIKTYTFYENPTPIDRESKCFDYEGRIEVDHLRQLLPSTEVDVYLCGSVPFMRKMATDLKRIGVRNNQIHYEVFGPTAADIKEETEITHQ